MNTKVINFLVNIQDRSDFNVLAKFFPDIVTKSFLKLVEADSEKLFGIILAILRKYLDESLDLEFVVKCWEQLSELKNDYGDKILFLANVIKCIREEKCDRLKEKKFVIFPVVIKSNLFRFFKPPLWNPKDTYRLDHVNLHYKKDFGKGWTPTDIHRWYMNKRFVEGFTPTDIHCAVVKEWGHWYEEAYK